MQAVPKIVEHLTLYDLKMKEISLAQLLEKLQHYLTTTHRISNGLPQAGVLVPFFEKGGQAYVLLTKRSSKLRKHSGQISFPGGTIEPEDQTVVDTALRETEEEVGLVANDIKLLGKFHDFATPYYSCVTPVIGSFDYPKAYAIQETEIDSILEVPIIDLLNTNIHHTEVHEYQGRNYTLHYYEWTDTNGEHYNIWGATGGVLYNLLSIIS